MDKLKYRDGKMIEFEVRGRYTYRKSSLSIDVGNTFFESDAYLELNLSTVSKGKNEIRPDNRSMGHIFPSVNYHLKKVAPACMVILLMCSNSALYAFSFSTLSFWPENVTGKRNVISDPVNAAASETSPQLRNPGT